ncbi:hypothetical protein LCM19_11965 [Qipengyuania flava]|nr:hypothetical protein [Qipengyuania flava]
MRSLKFGCLWIGGPLAALLLAYLAYLYSIDFFAADNCSDAGGSFHYDRGECSFTETYGGEVPDLRPV